MDLDGFKEVNDSLGHHVGDALLREVGRRIRRVLRKVDTVARLGGDEFAVIPFGATNRERALVIADKIVQALAGPVVIEDNSVQVGGSLGVALYPQDGSDAETLLRHADVAMYAAKRARSGVSLYAEGQEEPPGSARLPLIGKLGYAIERFELLAHYQPIVDMRTSRLTSVEALIRWGHPNHGLLPPDDFIPAAEQSELIKPLTAWILNEALGQLSAWDRAGIEVPRMAVNLSPRNLLDEDLPDLVQEMLETWQIAPDRLTLEITERSILAAAADETVNRLHAIGVRLAVDDFGTGYSSLTSLKRLPVSEIKIDRSFVADVTQNRDDAAIVRSTIDLAHNLGLTVVGEGIETAETWSLLAQHGCDRAQGFYLSPPVSPEALAAWLRDWREPAQLTISAG
jgi:diguanylate cyclase (GGDEF)-like protein